jgi:hypothetical protein
MNESVFVNPRLLGTCPKCNKKEQVTIESKPTKEKYTRRRKECRACGHRVTTYEVDECFYTQAKTMLRNVQNMLKLFKETKEHQGCNQCVHSGRDGCSYDFPEFNTPEAIDCIFYETAS